MKKFKSIKKEDLFNLLIISILFLIIVLITKGNSMYSSVTDNITQHLVIPEYFRTLFYDTFDFFPDFALNLGAGQNIYNFSYYGLFNPVIMLSYLFPFISMSSWVSVSAVILAYLSVILFYYFLRRHKFGFRISLLATICFMASTSLLFHTHRHIMFMNYMPFLMIGLIGVDRYFEKNDKKLLCISTVLLILMSYYFSIPGIICFVIYGVYRYIGINKKITLKKFLCDGLKFIFPIIVGILISCILLVPTFIALLSGRMDSSVIITLKELLVPTINVTYLMYNGYGVGLTSIALFSLINSFDKRRENKFLVIVLFLLILFPIFNYVLNGFMYITSKVLIPMLPLYVYVIALFLDKLFNNKINVKYFISTFLIMIGYILLMGSHGDSRFYPEVLFMFVLILLTIKFNIKYIFDILLIIVVCGISIGVNTADNLMSKSKYYSSANINQGKLVKEINTFDRTSLYNYNLENVNNIYGDIDIYQNTVYSSLNNKDFNVFFFDTFENVMQSRNRLILSTNKNIFFLMFMNNRYVIADNYNIVGYNEKVKLGNTSLYENKDVLPFMYVSNEYMSESDFNEYSFPYTEEIFLNKTVLSDKESSEYISNIKEVDYKFFDVKDVSQNISYSDGILKSTKNNSIVKINVPDEVKNKILFISFEINEPQSCSKGDLTIDINGERNKLTCKEWKYYNGNNTFNYVIADKNLQELEVIFSKGEFKIENLKTYYIDYNDIINSKDDFIEVNIDKEKTKNNEIYGSVSLNKDGVLVTSIPYDSGFSVFIDGEETPYKKVNTAFVGFDIKSGKHDILIKYNSPGKLFGTILSIVGLVLYFIFIRKRN